MFTNYGNIRRESQMRNRWNGIWDRQTQAGFVMPFTCMGHG